MHWAFVIKPLCGCCASPLTGLLAHPGTQQTAWGSLPIRARSKLPGAPCPFITPSRLLRVAPNGAPCPFITPSRLWAPQAALCKDAAGGFLFKNAVNYRAGGSRTQFIASLPSVGTTSGACGPRMRDACLKIYWIFHAKMRGIFGLFRGMS